MDFFDLFSDVPESLVVVSPEYKVLAATDAYLKVTMRSREDIVGKHFLKEAFPEKDIPYDENPVKLALDQTLTSKKIMTMDVIRYDLVIPEIDGGGYKELYWETSYIPGLDAEGNVKYIIQKAVNVTERELAKRGQLESESKFKMMTNAVPQLIYTMDAKGNLTYVNDRWERFTGLSPEVTLKSQEIWLETVHPEDRAELLAKREEAFLKGEEFQLELRLRDKDGNYKWFLSKCAPVRLAGKEEISLWVGSSTDVHTTRNMVQELLQANEQMSELTDQVQAALSKAENQRLTLERLIMQAPAIFAITTGPDHRFELVNPHYQNLFPERQFVGRAVAEAVPEVVDQGFIRILDDVYNTQIPFVAHEIPVVLDWNNSGKEEAHYFTTTYQPLLEDGKSIGIIIFGYEVTDKVLLRQELEALKNLKTKTNNG